MPSPDSIIRRAGARRARAVRRAEAELSRIAGVLLDQGDDANVNQAAIETGIARTTLYRRMDEVRRLRELNERAAAGDEEAVAALAVLVPSDDTLAALLPSLDSPDAPAPQPADTDR